MSKDKEGRMREGIGTGRSIVDRIGLAREGKARFWGFLFAIALAKLGHLR